MKKTILLLSISIIVLMSKAQSTEWALRAGGTNSDYGNNICTDANGNIYVTGSFGNTSITFGSYTLTNNGSVNIFITKYDSNGNVIWAKSAGGTSADVGNGIGTDASGNVYITGYFTSSTITFGSTTLTNAGTSGTNDFFIAKYDASGNVLWAKRAGGANYDYGSSIKTDANGNSYVSGFWRSVPSITFGSITITNSTGYSALFVVKYDASGNAIWAKSAACISDNNPQSSLAIDANSNVFVTGNFMASTMTFGSITINNTNTNLSDDVFIVKYDVNGNVVWAKNAGGSGIDCSNSINTDNLGNVFVTGFFLSNTITFGTSTFTNAGSLDFFVVKYDASGNIIWARNSGGSSVDEGFGISTDLSNNIYVCGIFSSPTLTFGTTTLSTGLGINGGIFIVKYDASGNILWAESTGGNGIGGSNVFINNRINNSIYLTGSFNSTATFGTTSLSSAGSQDMYIAKLCAAPPTIPVITQIGNILESSSANNYQWFFYSNPISGATSQNYQPTMNGYYIVIITDNNGCSSISSPYNLTNVSIKENVNNDSTNIFPNPAFDNIIIENRRQAIIEISDIQGQLIKTITSTNNKTNVDISALNAGVYIIKVSSKDGVVVKKIIKE